MDCSNREWLEFIRDTFILAIMFLPTFYDAAQKYDKGWEVSNGKGIPRFKTLFIVYLAWFTPFVILMFAIHCASIEFRGILFIIPIWVYGWLRWFYFQFRKH